MSGIYIHCEDVDFTLPESAKTLSWIKEIIESKKFELEELNYIFCSDEHLLKINQQYLDHDYFTDIITFDNSDKPNTIEGDVFISIDRVNDNANTHRQTFNNELYRVMAHGVLHLLGANDKTESEKMEMRKLEDHYLALREI